MNETSYSVAIVGASGYAGGEVLRLMLDHPAFAVTTLCAQSSVGEDASLALPHLPLCPGTLFVEPTAENLAGHEIVVLGLPHGASGPLAANLREENPDLVIADLGADFRLENAEDWGNYYGGPHAGSWTYGLPELPLHEGGRQRELLRAAREIAVPGCNATALTFAALPLVTACLVDTASMSAVLSVGYSGAGKAPKPHLQLAEAISGATPYSAGGMHRHIPEIVQNLSRASGRGRDEFRLTLTPVLVPMSRGIMAVLTAKLGSGVSAADVGRAFESTYAGEPFVKLYGEGGFPSTSSALGTNTVHIGWATDSRSGTVTVMAGIDNLVKGTAGAAVQSLNLALGLDEATGLPVSGLHP